MGNNDNDNDGAAHAALRSTGRRVLQEVLGDAYANGATPATPK